MACSLLRDVTSKRTVAMSPKLIDLLYLIQAWLRLNKLPAPSQSIVAIAHLNTTLPWKELPRTQCT